MTKINKSTLTLKDSPILFNDDNYLFATQIAKLGGKRFSDWKCFGKTRDLLHDINKKYKQDINLIQTFKGGSYLRGSWIHPILLPYLINWCMPEEIDKVEEWLGNICENSSLEINNETEDEEETEDEKDKNIEEDNRTEILETNIINSIDSNIEIQKETTPIENSLIIEKLFKFTDKNIMIYGSFETPYFRAKDIANALEYSKTEKATADHVRDKNKILFKELVEKFRLLDLGGQQIEKKYSPNELNSVYLSEAGLYELIFASKMKKAVEFKDWIFEDILPSIRKIGQEKVIRNLENKIEQNKWLHNKAKFNATFEIRTLKTEGLYMGAHSSEAENYIYKIGKSINAHKREKTLSVSSSTMNKFNMLKTYETYIDLSRDIESFIHALLSPLSANVGGVRKEHFIANSKFLDNFINKVTNDVDLYVKEINNYIILLKNNEFNYEKIEEILDKEYDILKTSQISNNDNIINTEIKEEKIDVDLNSEKICNKCKLSKKILCFEIYRKDRRAATCIACRNMVMIQCNKCKISKLGSNFRVKEDGKRQQGCIDCVPNITILIKCQKCEVMKEVNSFDCNEKGVRYRYCRICKVPKRKCLRCKQIKHNYNLTPVNELRKYCDDCYEHVQQIVKYKECLVCRKKVLKTMFSEINDLKRNRICDPCRSIK